MKATLTFNLPEDQPEFEDATNGNQWKDLVYELDQNLRSFVKYENIPESEKAILDKVREGIYAEMHDRGLSFN